MGMPMVMLAYEGDVDCTSSSESLWRNRMYSYGKEICFLLAIIFTSYAALHSPPPKVSKVPAPVRFFRPDSVVDDYYSGNLNAAVNKFLNFELSFVMFYAPWDAESQKVMVHFEAVARCYHKQIYFAAINCWQPGSECRQQYAKIPVFPVLMLYPLDHTGIHYKGVREVYHMVRFLRTALHPLERITTVQELMTMMPRREAIAVCYLDFQENEEKTSKLYNAFYEASLNFLERDSLQEITFAVVTSRNTAAQFEVYEMPSIQLYMWNESVYSNELVSNWTAETISQWVVQNLHQVAIWVQPPGIKSLTLSSYLQDGPVLLLFTPRNPLLHHIYYYDLLREVASEFYNCNNSAWVAEMNKLLSNVRHATPRQYMNQIQECASRKKCNFFKNQAVSTQHEAHIHSPSWQNVSLQGEESKDEIDSWFNYLSFRKGSVTSNRIDVRSLKSVKVDMFNGLTSMLIGTGDDLWAENLEIHAQDDSCLVLRLARLLDKPFYPDFEELSLQESESNITGFACSANKTLSFLALDSLQLHQFAEGLGVDVLHRTDKTAIFILNPEQETHHFLQGNITKKTLVNFIRGYANNTLPRWLRSTSSKPRDAGFSFGPIQTLHLSRYSERVIGNCTDHSICVTELSSSNFKSAVLDSKKNVILLYYTPYCAFCNGVSHIFLTVAHSLRSVNTMVFARIDGDNNDLPWEFTMHQFPSILFFPAQKKSESHIFPSHMQITTHNLLQFILSNLSPEERVWALLVICKNGSTRLPLSFQDKLNSEKCLTQVKIEVLQAAGHFLNKYRSLIINWSEELTQGRRESSHLRRSLQRHLSARLRFFRHASSTLMALSSTNSTLSVSDALQQVREAFFLQKKIRAGISAKDTSSMYDHINLNIDYVDVAEKLISLNNSIHGTRTSSNVSRDEYILHDEL